MIKVRRLLSLVVSIVVVGIQLLSSISHAQAQGQVRQICDGYDTTFYVPPGQTFVLTMLLLNGGASALSFDVRDENTLDSYLGGSKMIQAGSRVQITRQSAESGNIQIQVDPDPNDFAGGHYSCINYTVAVGGTGGNTGGSTGGSEAVPTIEPAPAPDAGSTNPDEFVSKRDGFAVIFGGKPTSSPQSFVEQGQKLTGILYRYQTATNTLLVEVIDYSPILTTNLSSADAQAFFDNVRGGVLKSTSATDVSHQAVTFADYPGQIYTAKSNTFVLKSRMYLVNGHVYALLATTNNPRGVDPVVDAFLDSFRLLNTP